MSIAYYNTIVAISLGFLVAAFSYFVYFRISISKEKRVIKEQIANAQDLYNESLNKIDNLIMML